jgi:recombinational DNA repair protein (RecF pathway)
MKATEEGILLHRISYSESSLVATFLTKNDGIKKFLFKGGKKKSPQLFPLSISELTFYGRKESELLNLTSLDPIGSQSFQFSPIRSRRTSTGKLETVFSLLNLSITVEI